MNIRPAAVKVSMPWEHHQVDTAGVEVGRELQPMRQRPAEPVQARDHQLVTGADDLQRLVELRATGELARDFVEEHPFAAGRIQRVALGVRILIAGRNPRVANPHTRDVARTPERMTQARTRVPLLSRPAEMPRPVACLVNDRSRTPGLVAAVGEADLEQLFELEDRAVARLLQPGGERPRPLAVIV
jgi:hypothetical protein